MLDPQAPATTGEPDIDIDRVEVEPEEIAEFVVARGYLSPIGADFFAEWLYEEWNDFTDKEPGYTNGAVIQGALQEWCDGVETAECVHGYRLDGACPGCDADEQDRADGEET